MRKIFPPFFLVASSFVFFTNFVVADDYAFPHPKGVIHNINGYGGSDTHQKKFYYSLDLRPYDEGGNRCNSYGAPVLATKAGKVIYVDKTGTKEERTGYGNWAKIEHSDKSIAIYGHMIAGSVVVNNGDTVKQGQILGLLGDTGNTQGMNCYAEYDGLNIGTHLHFENRDKDNEALAPEPLIGENSYTNIVETTYGERGKIVDGYYISTTLMYDPTGHWAKYAGKVPYRLAYNPTLIESFSPLIIEGGNEQVFTIKGENLFENLKVILPGCKGGIKWAKREGNEQQFTCTMIKPKQPEIRPGYIEFGAEKVHFKIEVLPDSTIPDPIITRAEAINPIADKMTDFVVEGEHLPGDLKLAMQDCQNTTYKFISPIKLEFACRLPHTVYDGNGRRINRTYTFNTQLLSADMGYSYPLSFSTDYEVMVQKLSPGIAYAGEKTLFTFAGKNINLVKAGWVENCYDLREVERSDEHVVFECSFRSEAEESLMSLLTPDIFKQNKFRILLKDKPNGTILFDERISVFYNKNLNPALQKQADEELYSEMAEGGGLIGNSDDTEPKQAFFLNENDNEAVIKYILESNGNYSNTFLGKMGWENVGTAKDPVYKLLDCKQELKNLGKAATGGQLNTTGECAQGLNNLFLKDAENEYYPQRID